MARVISVRPHGSDWIVADLIGGVAEVFPTGAQAEAAGRRRLDALACAGEAAELRIYLRDGSLAGRFVSVVSALEPA